MECKMGWVWEVEGKISGCLAVWGGGGGGGVGLLQCRKDCKVDDTTQQQKNDKGEGLWGVFEKGGWYVTCMQYIQTDTEGKRKGVRKSNGYFTCYYCCVQVVLCAAKNFWSCVS